MPHIHTEPGQHDFTTSAYIVRTDTPEPTILLHRHKKLKKYLQFGGHVELLENPWDSLRHEIAEESGYELKNMKILQPQTRLKKLSGAELHPMPLSIQTHPFPGIDHYHIDIAFALLADKPPTLKLGEGESAEMVLLTREQVVALPAEDVVENVRETALYIFDTLLKEWQAIPCPA